MSYHDRKNSAGLFNSNDGRRKQFSHQINPNLFERAPDSATISEQNDPDENMSPNGVPGKKKYLNQMQDSGSSRNRKSEI